jgi:hypothetical protein
VSIYLPGDVIAPEKLETLLDDRQQTRRIPDAVEVDLWADSQSVL